MYQLKMWDIQARVVVETGRELCSVEGIYDIKCGKANTPYLTCAFNKDNPIFVTIHVFKKVFQVQLTGSHEDLKVCYHTEGNVVLGIVDKLQSMLPPLDSIKSIKE